MSLFKRKVTLQVAVPALRRLELIKETAEIWGVSEIEAATLLVSGTEEAPGASEVTVPSQIVPASTVIGGRTFANSLQPPIGDSLGKSWSDMEVSFKVKKTSDGKNNEADIQIHNINTESIGLFQDRRAIVRLFAGYDVEKLIFTGTAIKNGVGVERSGPDRVLRIQAQDTRRKFERAQLNVSFSTATTLSQVLNQISVDGDVPLGIIKLEDDVPFPNGIHLTGNVRQVMRQLAEVAGVDWSIQDGAIQMVPPSSDSGEAVVLFSTKNGNLLHVERKEKGKVEMKALLEGSIRPGGRYKIESEFINGIFKAQEVEFSGSLFENDFFVTVLGRPSPTAPVPSLTPDTAFGVSTETG